MSRALYTVMEEIVDRVDGKGVVGGLAVFCFGEGNYSWSWCFVAYAGNVGLTEGGRRVVKNK